MSVQIIITDRFKREAKKLVKKYRSLKIELQELVSKLEVNPTEGIQITENTYKIRLAVKSKGKGKSGGMRIITYVYELNKAVDLIDVYLLSIYDKSDYSNISDKVLRDLISGIETSYKEENEGEDIILEEE